MLKVVGASWHKTRIGTYILMGAGLLVIGAFFLADLERPKYDGTYCATAFWTEKVGFQIEYWKQSKDIVNIPKGVARICYKDSIYENGWAQLELETQRNFPDWAQAFGAGILEGSLTWNNIYNQWLNTISSACDKDEDSQNFCTWLRDTLSSNYEIMKERAEKLAKRDHYWHQINLFFAQLKGLEHGWKRGATRARSDLEEKIPFVDFLLMNAAADIQDLKIYFENIVMREGGGDSQSGKNFFLPSATMLARMFQSKDSPGWKVIFGHTSAASYSSMLRIQKRYKFRYHFTPDQKSNTVPGMDIRFTGYPGILASTDDFYIIKGRQVNVIVAGVAIKNDNLKLWNNVDLKAIVPLSARVMAANRLSQSRFTWIKLMSRNTGTGSKQWINIDLSKLDAFEVEQETSLTRIGNDDNSSRKGTVWIIEQLPGQFEAHDVTEEFLSNSTWITNGVPYFDNILEASAIAKENFSIDLPNEQNLTNLEAVDRYLRDHAFRGDLLGDESIAYGNIDIKLLSYDSGLELSDFHAFSGPLFNRFQHRSLPTEAEDDAFEESLNNLSEIEVITDRRRVRNDMRAIAMRKVNGPFKWSSVADRIPGIEHTGHPDEWNFEMVSPKWSWHD